MKVYVLGYRTKTPEQIETERRQLPPFAHIENIEVQYSPTPDWRMPAYEADYQCNELRGMHVHVGQHICDFAIEELPEGDNAIMCAAHPDFVSHSQ